MKDAVVFPEPVRYGTGSIPASLLDLKIVLPARGGRQSFWLRSRRVLCIHELRKKQARFIPNKLSPNPNQFDPPKSCGELSFPQLSGGELLTSLLLGANCSQGPYLHPGDGLGRAETMGERQPRCGLGGIAVAIFNVPRANAAQPPGGFASSYCSERASG